LEQGFFFVSFPKQIFRHGFWTVLEMLLPADLLKGTGRVVTGKLVQPLPIGKNLWHTLRGASF
jgi:hypothetical protein